MIDLITYRLRVGRFNGSGPKKVRNIIKDRKTNHFRDTKMSNGVFVFNTIIYLLLTFLSLSLLILSYCNNHIFLNGGRDWMFPDSRSGIVGGLPFLSLVYLKIAYLILIFKAVCKCQYTVDHRHSSILEFCVGTPCHGHQN